MDIKNKMTARDLLFYEAWKIQWGIESEHKKETEITLQAFWFLWWSKDKGGKVPNYKISDPVSDKTIKYRMELRDDLIWMWLDQK